ncbi:MAG: putative transcriptional regulator [Paraglaciecola sp.]|jgi:predicted transcriptional regulator
MYEFKCLTSVSLSGEQPLGVNEIAEALELNSPASKVLTDFTRRRPFILDYDTSIDEGLTIMLKTHEKFRMVVDEKLNMIGGINIGDLMSHKVLMSANEKGLKRRDITVSDIMTPIAEFHGLMYNKLVHATIGDVLTTMRSLGVQYLLVLDQEHHVRGIICAADISRALHMPVSINVNVLAHNFKDVYKVLHNHTELS